MGGWNFHVIEREEEKEEEEEEEERMIPSCCTVLGLLGLLVHCDYLISKKKKSKEERKKNLPFLSCELMAVSKM